MSTSMLHEDLIFLNYKTTNFKNLIEELSHILYRLSSASASSSRGR